MRKKVSTPSILGFQSSNLNKNNVVRATKADQEYQPNYRTSKQRKISQNNFSMNKTKTGRQLGSSRSQKQLGLNNSKDFSCLSNNYQQKRDKIKARRLQNSSMSSELDSNTDALISQANSVLRANNGPSSFYRNARHNHRSKKQLTHTNIFSDEDLNTPSSMYKNYRSSKDVTKAAKSKY